LVQLLLSTKFVVQPHYIVRSEDSTGIEIDAMINIRRAISREYPEVMTRFLPTLYTNAERIPSYPDITEQIEELSKSVKIFAQYKMMSNYCRAFNIHKIEVCYEKNVDTLPGDLRLSQYFGNSKVFENFINPLEELTKRECYHTAKLNGWDDILNMTSTCRRPIKKIKPCGMCTTCIDMVIDGMGFTLPLSARIKANLQLPFRKFWRKHYPNHQNSKLFKLIHRKLEHRL